jgi:hypothetical protein
MLILRGADFSNALARHIKGKASHKIISDGKDLAELDDA